MSKFEHLTDKQRLALIDGLAEEIDMQVEIEYRLRKRADDAEDECWMLRKKLSAARALVDALAGITPTARKELRAAMEAS